MYFEIPLGTLKLVTAVGDEGGATDVKGPVPICTPSASGGVPKKPRVTAVDEDGVGAGVGIGVGVGLEPTVTAEPPPQPVATTSASANNGNLNRHLTRVA
jgi:hypothetical protein